MGKCTNQYVIIGFNNSCHREMLVHMNKWTWANASWQHDSQMTVLCHVNEWKTYEE